MHASLNKASYSGGIRGDHPIAWYHAYDDGRAWYTAGGHTRESYSEPLFLAHLMGEIEYAAGGGAYSVARWRESREPDEGQAATVGGRGTFPFVDASLLPTGELRPSRSIWLRSIGSGKTIVLFFSAANSVSACK